MLSSRSCLLIPMMSLGFVLPVFAQGEAAAGDSARIAEVLRIRDKIEKDSKTFHFGLSIGWRHTLSNTGTPMRDASIDPTTNKVTVDSTDVGDFVLSGTVTAFPWAQAPDSSKWHKINPLGFIANINIASFNADNLSTFNKSIEGGFGVAWRLASDFAIGATIERKFSRRLRDFVKPNTVLTVGKDTITTLARDDDRFFHDDNLTALSFKFLYFLK